MKLGIIDIGSNTIKTTLYSYSEGILSEKRSKTIHAKLSSYVESGALSDEGASVLVDSVRHLRKFARKHGCKKKNIYAFATACVRNASNKEFLLERVLKEAKIKIDLLSGEDEAEMCFIGALASKGCPTSGILADLGGGSCEFISFSDSRAYEKVSLNVGALAMYKKFATERFMTLKDTETLDRYLENEFSERLESFSVPEGGSFILTGGSARTMAKLDSELCGNKVALPYSISLDSAKKLCERISSGEISDIYEKVAKDRAETLLPAIRVFVKAAEQLSSDTLTVIGGGARDGYAFSVLKKGARS